MKKPLIILTSLFLICIMLIGCNNTDTTINTSKELTKNLNLLSNTVRRLDTVDNQYLISSDLYSLEQTSQDTTAPARTSRTVLANSYNVIVSEDEIDTTKINLTDTLTNALKNEIVNRLYCDENGNCKLCKETFVCDDDGICNSCNQTYICDSNGNCTSCNTTLNCNNDNNCSNCNTNCITSDYNINISNDTLNCLKQISEHNNNLEVEFLNSTTNNVFNDNNYRHNELSLEDNANNSSHEKITTFENTNENSSISDTINKDINLIEQNNNTLSENNEDSNIQEESTNNNNQSIDFYYYSEETFMPHNLRYKPRYISSLNYATANNNLENYIEKLQKLYTMTADVVEANNTLANYRVVILNNIDETKSLNDCIISGTCTPTNNQISALNNYIADIKNTVNNLRNCNGDLVNEMNKITTGNTGIVNSIEVTNSNYLRILNQIDTRISYHENALATLEQIKYILEDAQTNNSNNHLEIEDLYKDQTILEDNISDDNNDFSLDANNNTTNNNDIIGDNNIVENNDSTDTDITDDNNSSSDEVVDNQEDTDIVLDTDLNNEDTDQQEVVDSTNEIEEDNSSDVSNNDINDDENSNADIIYNDDNTDINPSIVDTQDSSTADVVIVDTDVNSDELKNIDTYNDNTYGNLEDDSNIVDNSNTDIDLNNENNDIIYSHTNETENIVNTNNTPNTPQMVDGTNNNSLVNTNNNIPTNNINPNTIISQNNINDTEIGNSSYHYDEDGSLYNNTNGFDGTEQSNINNKENNVNTYKYNTLVDSINRGTISNGINNL